MRPRKQFRYRKLPVPRQEPIKASDVSDFALFVAQEIAAQPWTLEEKLDIGVAFAAKYGAIFDLHHIGIIMGGISRQAVSLTHERALQKLARRMPTSSLSSVIERHSMWDQTELEATDDGTEWTLIALHLRRKFREFGWRDESSFGQRISDRKSPHLVDPKSKEVTDLVIKTIREGHTQEQVAKLCGVHRQYVRDCLWAARNAS